MDYLDELRLIDAQLQAQFDAVVRAYYPLAVAFAAVLAAKEAHTDAYFRRPGCRPEEEVQHELAEARERFEALLIEYPRARAARQAWQAVGALASQVEYDITEYMP